jgi:hypothetical protein
MLTKIAVFFNIQPRNYFMISTKESPVFLNLDLAVLFARQVRLYSFCEGRHGTSF